MIYPTIQDLSQSGTYNRYQVALAAAKCARLITNEYVRQREAAERSMTGNKETDKPLNALIDREVRDEKAVKIAIKRLDEGAYTITRKDPELQRLEEEEMLRQAYRPEHYWGDASEFIPGDELLEDGMSDPSDVEAEIEDEVEVDADTDTDSEDVPEEAQEHADPSEASLAVDDPSLDDEVALDDARSLGEDAL